MDRCVGCGAAEELGVDGQDLTCFDCFVARHAEDFRIPPELEEFDRKYPGQVRPIFDEAKLREQWLEASRQGKRLAFFRAGLSAEIRGAD